MWYCQILQIPGRRGTRNASTLIFGSTCSASRALSGLLSVTGNWGPTKSSGRVIMRRSPRHVRPALHGRRSGDGRSNGRGSRRSATGNRWHWCFLRVGEAEKRIQGIRNSTIWCKRSFPSQSLGGSTTQPAPNPVGRAVATRRTRYLACSG